MAKMCFPLVFGILFALQMGPSLTKAAPEPEPVDGEVLYDSSLENNVEAITEVMTTEVKMPESCEGKSYCFDRGADYPEATIANLLKDIRKLKLDDYKPPSDIGDRNGNSQDPKDCPEGSTKEPIYYITDTNDKVRVVVQLKDKFEQIYSVKWCLTPGRITEDTTHFLKDTTLKNFNVQCVDAKMDFDFFVLREEVDSETNKPSHKMEIARVKGGGIPVCCKCQYELK